MREIKLKVYSLYDGKMYEPFTMTYDFPSGGGDFSKDSIFLRSTGLTIGEDEVWEDDILEFTMETGEKETGVVRFAAGGFWTSQKEGDSEELLSEELEFYKGNVKIIGNIYQTNL